MADRVMTRSELPARRECGGCHTPRPVGEFETGGDRCASCRLTAPIVEGTGGGRAGSSQVAAGSERKAGYKICPYCEQPKSNVSEHRKRCKQRPGANGTGQTSRRRGRPRKAGSRRDAETQRGNGRGAGLLRRSPESCGPARRAVAVPVRGNGGDLRTIDEACAEIEQVIRDCQTTLRVLAMVGARSGHVPR